MDALLGTVKRSQWIAGGLFAFVLVLITIVSYVREYGSFEFDLWTNLLFLLPVGYALIENILFIAVVIWMTFAVSTVHHGCLSDSIKDADGYSIGSRVREEVAPSTFIILLIGIVVALMTGGYRIWISQGAPSSKHPKHVYQMGFIAYGMTLLVALILVIWGLADTLKATPVVDGCLYVYTATNPFELARQVSELHRVWAVSDMVTATSAALVVAFYFFQFNLELSAASLWATGILTLILQQLDSYNLITSGSAYAILVYAVAILVLGYIEATSRNWMLFGKHLLYSRAAWLAILTIGTAFVLYFCANTPGVHGLWHILGGLALTLVLVIGHDSDNDTNVPEVVDEGAFVENSELAMVRAPLRRR